jgi:NifB/MoaA-like Fe-S oxidoreductase
VPAVVLRQGEPVFLDDLTLETVSQAVPVPLRLVQGADDIVAACLVSNAVIP